MWAWLNKRDLFGHEVVVGCFCGKVDGALDGAEGEAGEDGLEDATEAVHGGGLRGGFWEKGGIFSIEII